MSILSATTSSLPTQISAASDPIPAIDKKGFLPFMKRKRQKGVTLVEAAIVLGIAALVVAGVIMAFQGANTSRQVNEAVNQVAQVQQAVRNMYAGQSSYSSLQIRDIATTNVLPTSMIRGSGTSATLANAFGGTITVAPADAGGGSGSGFSIVFQGVPSEACTQIATKDFGRGMASISVSGGTATTSQTPLTPSQAASACGNATNNQITWIFR